MPITFQCPHCQAANSWPDYVLGKQVTCPACQQRFLAKQAVSAEPSVPPEPSFPDPVAMPEIPTVLPVEDDPPPRRAGGGRRARPEPTLAVDCTQAIRDVCGRRDLQRLSPPRRVVYALLVASLEILRPNFLQSLIALFLVPLVVLFAVALGFAIMFGIYAVAVTLDRSGIPIGYVALYLPPGFVFLTAYYSKQWIKEEPIVLARDSQEKVERIKLGRLDGIFHIAGPATSLFFVGALLSMQTGLLYYMPGHLAVTREGTLLECSLLTIDNLCHGVLLDTCEMYEIYFAHKVEHTWWNATVFYAFRLSYEAFLIIAGYQLYRHYSMRRMFHGLPYHWRNVDFVLQWIEEASRTESEWAREFLDEFLFLVLAGAYLAGDDAMVRDVDRRFPWLRIKEDVRKLFADDYGGRLFEYQPEAS